MRSAAMRRFPFAYGDGSFAAHMASARALGLSAETVEDPRLCFDLDEPAQYLQWAGASMSVTLTQSQAL